MCGPFRFRAPRMADVPLRDHGAGESPATMHR
ncbi:hypothetical protein J2Y70_001877 [Xanthomonas translucens]|nr:hypothetical protein [Xanthomonas translucens]